MSDAGWIEIILSLIELLFKPPKKKQPDHNQTTIDTTTLIRKIKEQMLPYVSEVKKQKLKDGELGLSFLLKPQRRPPESLDVIVENKKIGAQTATYISVVGRCSFPTMYALEFEPHNPAREVADRLDNLQKIEVGIKEIDKKVIVRTNDIGLTKQLFKDEEIKKYFNSLSGLKYFKISPGRNTTISVNVTYSRHKIVHAFHLIKRFAELLSLNASSSEKNEIPVTSSSAKLVFEDEKPRKTTKSIETPQKELHVTTKPLNKKIGDNLIVSLNNEFRKEFLELQGIARRIEFKPNQDLFNQVIVVPWTSGIAQVKYDLGSSIKIIGLGQRYSKPREPLKFTITKLKDISLQYPEFNALKSSVKISASDESFEKELQGKYELLRLVAQIKGLSQFTAECSSEKIIVTVLCELTPQNIRPTYKAIIEAVNILKLVI